MVANGRLVLLLRLRSAAMSSLLFTVRSLNGTPRKTSRLRALTQGGQSSPVYRVTGKRLETCRTSSGSAELTGTTAPEGERIVLAVSLLGARSEKVTLPSGPTMRWICWAWARPLPTRHSRANRAWEVGGSIIMDSPGSDRQYLQVTSVYCQAIPWWRKRASRLGSRPRKALNDSMAGRLPPASRIVWR